MHADLVQDLRRTFGGTFIVNSGFSRTTTRDEAVTAVDENIADLIAVGRPAIANPDLVTRWSWWWGALAASFGRFEVTMEVVGPPELAEAFAVQAERFTAAGSSAGEPRRGN